MHIKELYLKNFRGFEELRIQFPEDLAVIIGVNGSGKSSVLDAIAILLSRFVKLVYLSKQPSFSIVEEDLNANAKNGLISIKATGEDQVSWGITVENNGGLFKTSGDEGRGNLISIGNDLRQNLYFKLGFGLTNLPILLYYQTNRFLSENSNKKNSNQRKAKIYEFEYEQFHAYDNAFTKGMLGFDDFVNWFRVEEDLENETRLRENPEYKNRNLEIIREAIQKFLNNLPNIDFSNLRIVRAKTDSEFKFRMSVESNLFITKNGQNLKIEQLSSGEKMLLMIVSDLARRLSIANQSLESNALGGKGVVLIDEVDLHLHPQWQRAVIPSLKRTFPNIQFIVTTHSPQVLSNVKKENILILEDYKVVDVTPHTYGRDSNSILYELMGVQARPEEVQKQLDKCFRLIDEEKLEEAKIALRELAQILGENDSEIVRAHTLINFLSE